MKPADLDVAEVLRTSSPEPAAAPTIAASAGLTTSQAEERLGHHGPNMIAAARPKTLSSFLRRFWGVVPWMLEAAVIIDLILGKWVEAGVIAVLLVGNSAMGFLQEGRAQKALALLRQRLIVNARVRRDGDWQMLPATELVPDDVVYLRLGDVVPADLRVIDGQMQVDQSQLTGESMPVDVEPLGTAYAGSFVNRGEATGMVTATGARTFFGKTAELIRTAEPPRRLEVLIVKIATYLGGLVMVLAIAAFVAMILRGVPLSEMLPFGVILLVGSVPIMLPTMFTMTAALGAHALAESGILVTRLSAIQDAASMDVLCLDKTGTLTENRLTVGTLAPMDQVTEDQLLIWGAQASDAATQDPIDLAILKAATARGLSETALRRTGFVPFDPATKRSEATFEQQGKSLRVVKGAPATIAGLTGTAWAGIADDVARLAADGSRVIAVAAGSGSDLSLAGFIGLTDPPRTDSAALIADLQKRGVRPLLVTGDGEATARAIAAKVGIAGEVAPPRTLREGLDPQLATRFAIFAGVYPQDKFYLVQALQKAGHTVGMTGDGVNDAPALRQADVGIAVARATDVTKAAASLVLTRPGLAEIIVAVDGSRRIYQRMRNFTLAMISRKMSTPTFYALWVIFTGALVVSPVQMVLLMLVGDISMMSVSTDRVAPSDKPDRWDVGPLSITGLTFAALLIALNSLVFWSAANVLHLGPAEAQTLVFVWLVFAGSQGILFLTRGRGLVWSRPIPGRWVLLSTALAVALVTILATQGWLMAPISLMLVAGLLILTGVFLIVGSVIKLLAKRTHFVEE
jgi:H+-transporting ATPase